MAQLSIRINGYAYTVACEDGQEPHLRAMADEVENRIERVRALGGQSGEAQMLVLAGLLMADELHDLGHAPPRQAPPPASASSDPRALDALAERAEEIAAGLERD